MSEFPTEAEEEEAAVVEGFLNPRFRLVFGDIFRLDRHVEEVARLQRHDAVLELFLDPGVQHAVLLEQGEESGDGALVFHIGRQGPAFGKVGGDVGLQAPVGRFLDLVHVAPGTDGVVVFQAQIGGYQLSAPAQLRRNVQDAAVRAVQPGEDLIAAVVDLLLEPGLLNLVETPGKGDGTGRDETLVVEIVGQFVLVRPGGAERLGAAVQLLDVNAAAIEPADL